MLQKNADLILSGLDYLIQNPQAAKSWGRVGLVSNQASISYQSVVPAWAWFFKHTTLQALFGPQHGFVSTVQDNMIESGHGVHSPTNLPLYSLYSDTRQPTEAMLQSLDTLVIDLVMTGCRVYTYKYTLRNCLLAAKEHGKPCVVLERINPLGGNIQQGPILEDGLHSFVSEFKLPLRHGMSAGELAHLFNADIGADLQVIPAPDWQREKAWSDDFHVWPLSSPNLSSIGSLYAFYGTVLLEGTNLSEGRGTTKPFELIGAPYIPDAHQWVEDLNHLLEPFEKSFHLHPTTFIPTFQKWQHEVCQGFEILWNGDRPRGYLELGFAILMTALSYKGFAWKQPPYEYNDRDLPIDLLIGSTSIRQKLEARSIQLSDSRLHLGNQTPYFP